MFDLVADLIFLFIRHKTHPFPTAMLSQEDFWNVPSWKRALVFLFGIRFVLNLHVTRQWKNWKFEEYVMSIRLFKRYISKDREIMEKSVELKKLDEFPLVTTKRRRRTTGDCFVPSPQRRKKTTKVVYTIDLASSDEND